MTGPRRRDGGDRSVKVPIVYSLPTCPSCVLLREDWTRQGVQFEERMVSDSQAILDEALKFGDIVPIVVYPDGRVTTGYKDMIGCAIV